MTLFHYTPTSDRISEEVNSDCFLHDNDNNDRLSALDLDSLFNLTDFAVAGECDYDDLAESLQPCFEPNELDLYLGPNSQSFLLDHDNNRAMNSTPVHIKEIGKEKKLKSNIKQIPLSQSVGVGLPQKSTKLSSKIIIAHDLEKFFRARYKSDYFAQNGKKRRPRYVADSIGNHFITLKIPVGIRGQIRVDWLTIPTVTGDRYSMPYRFQQSNESSDVPDCNPIYINITSNDSLGTMKIYLVLIKSKQDELKSLQPLKPFHPFQDAFGIPDKSDVKQMAPLMPKQLIQQYQLDKSQLAFTYCSLSADGQSRIHEWDTTAYSTVLNELPPESKQKIVACPNCAQSFQITLNGDDDNVQETQTSKRKTDRYFGEKPIQIIKKQRSIQEDFININQLLN